MRLQVGVKIWLHLGLAIVLFLCAHGENPSEKKSRLDDITYIQETSVKQSSVEDRTAEILKYANRQSGLQSDFIDSVTDARAPNNELGEKSIDTFLTDQDKLFTPEDVNTRLKAASVDSLARNTQNLTLLDKMRDLMDYEEFLSDISMLDSFNWFDDTAFAKSRIRRASESYRYRRFQQPLRAYIPEGSPPGTKVLTIPRNFDGTLEIVSPENSIFRVRSDTGALETTERLDFETKKVYNLIIRDSESDTNDSPFYSHDVIVYVTDDNDNKPKFEMMSFTGHVNSASRVGSFVAQLNASDADNRERGRIGFIIGDQNSPFTVNPTTWVMETNGKLLATSQASFPVNIRTFDQGYPRQESDTVVMNVNRANNPPRFSQSQYTFTFPETTLPGVVIGQVAAISLSNIPVGYEVVPTSDVFAISQRGEVSLKRSMDFETAGNLTTTIIAVRASELTDSNPLSSQVSVTLVVTNYDENPTTFSEVIYRAQIDEDVDIGTLVTSVRVKDCDCAVDCQCTGNEIDFTVMDANGYFEIGQTGEIRTAKHFDYDIQGLYEFAVVAWDRVGSIRDTEPARAYVSVKLRDVNNNAPRFTQTRYQFVVNEDSKVGHLVGVVQATDKDNLGSPLSYSITGSSPRGGLFVISDSRFGILVVASLLKDETESTFVLTIEASDGVLSSETTVEINVEDVNDNAPQFTSCPESLSVKENLEPGALVTILRAVDSDRGKHANIEYFIEDSHDLFSPENERIFVVNNQTGEIQTASKLDRERSDRHFLISSARDQTSDSQLRQIGYCQFVILVEDENDNYPIFEVKRYETSVHQDLAVGSQVLQVRAIDRDVGINARMTYTIDGGSTLFGVALDGWITVKSSLQGNLGMKSLTITAGNTEPYHSVAQSDNTQKTTVEILVTDKDLPRFSQSLFQTNVLENTTVGSTVLTLSAEPTSGGASVIYYLADMRFQLFPFRVDHSTGDVTLSRGLDYEARTQYVFAVNAHDLRASELVQATVEINVADVNDVAPFFGRSRYDATVSEDAPPGTLVIRIRAIDYDPMNVAISYEIEKSSDSHLFKFRIHGVAIEIMTNATFDREALEYYHVGLVAIDNGNPQLRGTTYVTVRVLDENDSPPVLDAEHYEVTISESTPVGTIIETVMSRDKDYGINARALFSIAAGNDGRFRMTSEVAANGSLGHLVVARPLDFEANSEYNLTVVSSDAKFSDTTTVTVKVTKSDDEPPSFGQSLYNTNLEENTPASTSVLNMTATDPDTSPTNLTYSLNTTTVPYFNIGPTTGELATTGVPLNREKIPMVVFPVYVTDGTSIASTFVSVNVLDVNESPYFPNAPYVGFVEENKPVGTSVRYVTAFDDDDPKLADGKNSKVSYSINRSSGQPTVDADGGLFVMDSTTGLLSTSAVFNLEDIRRNFTIMVRATDDGSPKLSATTLVTIVVEDVSEFPPKFSDEGFVGKVSEDAVLGTVVMKLSTTDQDFTNVGHRYAITDGNYPFAFYIEPSTSQILVAGILDYETKPGYNLTVSVTEQTASDVFPKDFATVYIEVLDANDLPPVFQPKNYFRSIPENVTIGTEVRVVTCSDMDEGSNAVPKFSITAGNTGDVFEVASHSADVRLGVVQVAGHLDREKAASYMLEITATDIGGLADTAVLVVEVEDINDTPPLFSPAYYEASIVGGVRREQYVTTINTTDPDQSPNGAPFVFRLNNTEDKFQLKNPTGHSVELYTTLHEFSRETAPLYQVIVVASDGGNPSQSAEAIAFVSVLDEVSDQEPHDGFMRIIMYTLDGQYPGGEIGEVYYKDDDYQKDQNDYVITAQEPGNHFGVESTGRISCVSDIPEGTYSINVTVREQNSAKTVLSQINIMVRNLNTTAVQHAVALRFPLRNRAIFINSLYKKLVTTLAEIFRVSDDHVYVFSVAQSSGGVAGSPYGVDVWIAVQGSGGDFLNADYVFTQLETNYEKIVALGVDQLEVGYDKCAEEARSVGVCENKLTAQQSYSVVSGYYGQVPAPSSSLTVVVINTDLQAVYTVLGEPVENCAKMPCMNGGTCHDVLPNGYVCECPRENRGPECQATTRTFNQPNSYIWLEPLSAYELSSFSFEFMSQPSLGSGLLLYQGALRQGGNNGVPDFIAVSLINGYVTVAISLGGRTSSFNLRKGQRLDDGTWHHVEIKRMKKEVRLIVDHCEAATVTEQDERFFEDRSDCEVIGQSFGDFLYLNGRGPLQIGGTSYTFSHSAVTTRSFYGCIRNIYDNNRMYDLHNPLKVVNAPLGCERGCQTKCQNEGYCEAEIYSGKSCCSCVPGFTGCDCSERSPSLWYIENSFSEYNLSTTQQQPVLTKVPDEPSLPIRQRRHIFARIFKYFFSYHTSLVFRIRVLANVTNAIFFRSSSVREKSFSELGIKNRMLYYTFKFADEMKTVTLTGATITDDMWHTVRVLRRGNTASLQLDYKAKTYGTTGGVVRMTSLYGGSMYTGGIPRYVASTDISSGSAGVSGGGISGSSGGTSGSSGGTGGSSEDSKRKLEKVDSDFQGCTGGVKYNGEELDEKFQFNRIQVVEGCPCKNSTLECNNNSTCADEEPPYCACPEGFTGESCDEIVTQPTPRPRFTLTGLREAARHRFLDPVWICVFLVCLLLLIFILCLLHTLPIIGGGQRPLIEEDAHDSIMAYQEHGAEAKDATGYDVTLLMKYSRRKVTLTTATMGAKENGGLGIDGVDSRGGGGGEGMVTSSRAQMSSSGVDEFGGLGMSGSGGAAGELGGTGTQVISRYGRSAGGLGESGTQEIGRERLEEWIVNRVREANEDMRFLSADEMDSVRYEARI